MTPFDETLCHLGAQHMDLFKCSQHSERLKVESRAAKENAHLNDRKTIVSAGTASRTLHLHFCGSDPAFARVNCSAAGDDTGTLQVCYAFWAISKGQNPSLECLSCS